MQIFLSLFLSLFLTACGGGASGSDSTTATGITSVTIDISSAIGGGSVATGAIAVTPSVIQSVSVQAFNNNGTSIAGPVVATAPNLAVTLAVPNGTGITFKVIAYSAANVKVYEGVSAPKNLFGNTIRVAISMDLSIVIIASPSTIAPGGTVTLTGLVGGSSAPVTSPLLWSATGGTLGVSGINGASNSWTAPAAVGIYNITANIDPAVNTIHNQTVTGTVSIAVVSNPNRPVITLAGAALVSVKQHGTYNDAGASAIDAGGANITASIVTVNSVDTLLRGRYSVTYNVIDAAGIAAVQVSRQVDVVDLTAPQITLTGSANVTVTRGATYSDAGATALDDVNGNITALIITSNPVNTAVAATYAVTYDVIDVAGNAAPQVTRMVTVTALDQTLPVISLIGNSPVAILQGSPYTDAGATATDDLDGTITANIVPVSTVNTATIANYSVTYNVSDAAGNAAVQVTRIVNVIATDAAAPVITLKGANPTNVAIGLPYIDTGATAFDAFDGDLSANITMVSNVNTAVAGLYSVTFNVSDAAANAATQVTRIVNVKVDNDNDGIPDSSEVIFGTDPNVANADHDGDTIFTRTELALRSDPLDAASRPAIAALLGQTNSIGVALGNAVTTAGREGDVSPYGLSVPKGMDIDTVNNRLFVADSLNNRILVFQLNATNNIASRQAIAVIGQADFEHKHEDRGNTETAATLQNPLSVAYYSATGNQWLAVTDSANHRVLIYDITLGISNGMAASIVLGQASMIGNSSGITNAKMNFPGAVRMLNFGTSALLTVCDSSNHRTLIWDISGGIGALANGAPATFVLGQTSFTSNIAATTASGQRFPAGIGQWGNHLLISDKNNNRVLTYNLQANAIGLSNSLAASLVIGQANMTSSTAGLSATALSSPSEIEILNNYLYIADHDNRRVLVYDITAAGGLLTGMAATYVFGQANLFSNTQVLSQIGLGNVYGLALGSNSLLVSDDWDDEIMGYDLTNQANLITAATFSQAAINGLGQSNWVPGMLAGAETVLWDVGGSNDTGPTSLANPKDAVVGVVGIATYLFVADESNDRVLAFRANASGVPLDMQADVIFGQADYDHVGANLTQWGMSGPSGIAFDAANTRLYVSDTLHHRILVYDLAAGMPAVIAPGVNATITLGQPTFAANAPTLTQTGLNTPRRLVVGSIGPNTYLFVVDGGNDRIMVFDITTPLLGNDAAAFVLGAATFTTNAIGANINQLANPYGIDFDPVSKRLFVADGDADRVLIWDLSAGIVNGSNATFMLGQTIASNALGNIPAVASQGQFDWVLDVAFDKQRNILWTADLNNSRLLGFDFSNGITTGMNASFVMGQPDYVTTTGYLGDHNRTSYTTSGPSGLTLGPQGHLLLVDENDDRVLVIAP